ncbi:MAG: acetate--CoA ligase family protein [Actinomycetota bacterium]|nr:acetate--CoA ligase family protein [Actinomycetota bacterium]
MSRLARLLLPRSVAVVGGQPAALAIEQCRRLGFDGDLWAVHPRREEVAGVPCVPTVDDLPGVPDAALVAVNRRATVDVVGRLAAMGAGAAVCYASGFAEAGPDGEALQRELDEVAGTMPVVGPNCYGTVSAVVGAALWPDQQGLRRVERGVALVTQSGNIGLDLSLQTRPMPIAHLLTLGNQSDVGIEECLEALVADPTVTAVGLHVEALHDVERFATACATASALGKPVVALKTGSSARGAEIAASHTSSMVGSDAAYEALFERLAVRRVWSLPELLDVLHVLVGLGGLGGGRLVSLSCSGGEASIVADRCDGLDLELPAFGADRVARIREALGDPDKAALVSVSNPFDYHTFIWDDRERLVATFTATLASEDDIGPDASLLVLDFPGGDLDDRSWWPTLEAFGDAVAATGTPGVVAASMAENLPPTVEAAAVSRGLVPVRGIDEALGGLLASAWWGQRTVRSAPTVVASVAGPRDTLDEATAKDMLADHGVTVPRRALVPVEEAAAAAEEIGFPVAVKATGLAHKTEVGGVALGLADRDAVAAAARRVAEVGDGGRVLVERQVDGAVAELLVTVRLEPPVGWLLTVGAGGALVEVLRDTASLLLPATDDEVAFALRRLTAWPLLAGHRGRPGADVDAVIDAVQALARVATSVDGLVEVEVNPLLVTSDGAVAVDALVTHAGSWG